jgi:RNA 2',3'-cyclic 3'-phosphodiesterase
LVYATGISQKNLTIFDLLIYNALDAMIRTFIGLKIDADRALTQLLSDFKKNLAGEQLRWIDPENLHLTLRFLGNTEDSQLADIVKGLDELIPKYDQFNLEIEGIGLFGKQSAPKILWAGIMMPQMVYNLVENIEEVVCIAGFAREERPFSPHLTLSRIKSITNTSRLISLVTQYKETHFQQQKVNQVILYESVLKSSGSVYVPIRIFNLNESAKQQLL